MFDWLRCQDENGIYRTERFDGEVLKIYLTSEEVAIEEAEMWLDMAQNPELEERTRSDKRDE